MSNLEQTGTLNSARIKSDSELLPRRLMSEQNAAVGLYSTHTGAEAAVEELQKSSFNMKRLSIVGRGFTRRSMSSASTTPATA